MRPTSIGLISGVASALSPGGASGIGREATAGGRRQRARIRCLGLWPAGVGLFALVASAAPPPGPDGAAPASRLRTAPKHVMFAFVDHFEPLPYNDAIWQVNMWVDDYMAMASQHTDADGRHPAHTYFQWFTRSVTYGNEFYIGDCLKLLNRVAYHGYGEVDYHLHHGAGDERTRTEETAASDLIDLLSRSMTLYNQRGCLITAEAAPQQAFAFIHGMWALDNSRLNTWSNPGDPHREYCGVNTELSVLRSWGCYVDYTFPTAAPMTPLLTDSIFYAQDDPFPASYQNRVNNTLVAAGQPPVGDLMIVEGPNTTTNVDDVDVPTLARMDNWVGHNVQVIGQNDWIFVKVYTHGCAKNLHQQSVWDAFFGAPMSQFYSAIEAKYNDGVNWKLHYVSAREMYNIIKAAEAGLTGDPGQYRDYAIPRYANMVILTDRKFNLLSYTPQQVVLQILDTGGTLDVTLKEFGLCSTVEESSDQTNWAASDGLLEAGAIGELRLVDGTLSRYYRVSGTPCPRGDYDHNGFIDLADYAFLPDCITGPGGGPPQPGCAAFDLNGNLEVDLRDYAAFQQGFGIPLN
jgi:hypothetical protein